MVRFPPSRFEPVISGDIPRPRYYHAAATVLQHEQIVVFGGRTKHHIIENLYVLKANEKILVLDINEEDDEDEDEEEKDELDEE